MDHLSPIFRLKILDRSSVTLHLSRYFGWVSRYFAAISRYVGEVSRCFGEVSRYFGEVSLWKPSPARWFADPATGFGAPPRPCTYIGLVFTWGYQRLGVFVATGLVFSF